ncbi:MAG TPA: di-heme oxidoredictase family protein [Leptospiraceae bacterium]|nr:di-heme oxidoredictase family protein [Leptospiraceae bacterium]HNN73147.1 di-heme oxidoredictase family protein [Leptospiraceae bacterium]HQI17712.1 di-heme oxidoredictase family protein [Leptospiraceae bacterium]
MVMCKGFPIVLVLLSLSECRRARDPGLQYSGGETTVFVTSSLAFSSPAANLDVDKMPAFTFGNRVFNTNWVTAPSSTKNFDGLGPFFNRVSCSSCHLLDGRGQPPETPKDTMDSMLVRVSLPGESEVGGPRPHPIYGDQINDRAILGVKPEGRITVRYVEIAGNYPDGKHYDLRRPVYSFRLNYGDAPGILFSPRVAPAIHGLGLLEAIPEAAILAIARLQASSGIQGKPNYVFNALTGGKSLGRFGWKANVPTLRQQNAGAALGDIGLTSEIFPRENITAIQKDNKALASVAGLGGDSVDLKTEFLDDLTFYTQTLGVPARRNHKDPEIRKGEQIFSQIGCSGCHVPTFETGEHPAGIKEVSHQVVHPYTDLLLHDMGSDLADGRPDFQASGSEWRTPPLWGIGLVEAVNRHTTLLHDGRARNLEEAILWHGGQAARAREAFKNMSEKERTLLLRFLKSL